jgi:glycosyltransferase involved in cell wall biosynthesis
VNILIVHQNFPGQFKHILEALIKDGKNQIVGFTMNDIQSNNDYRIVRYMPRKGSTKGIHSWAVDIETKIIRGEAAYWAALKLKNDGFYPNLILAHPGWGESLYLKEVWPTAKLIIYCEFFYSTSGLDVGFDPEFPASEESSALIRSKNFNNLLHFDIADAGISPTYWQKSTFPKFFQKKINVIHDGVDTNRLLPNQNAKLTLNLRNQSKLELIKNDDVITFVNRNLEPYRGYHIFMKALPIILNHRPNLKVLIVGGDNVSYGAAPDYARFSGQSWKEIYANEARKNMTEAQWQQVFFLGNISYENFIALLQISKVHIYLTYPFILSWSLIEAMSIGCAIIGSKTGPVLEVIEDNENGELVDFFDFESLANKVINLLNNSELRRKIGISAREFAIKHYDLNKVCIPKMLDFINSKVH